MPLSSQEIDFINLLEQYWFEYGSIPSKDYCNEIFGESSTNDLWKSFTSSDFRDAVLSRGISLRGLNSEGPQHNSGFSRLLTEEQLVVANTMLDIRDNRSQKKKLMDLQVSTQKYEGWLRDPAYQNYITQRAEQALGDNQHEAHLALVGRVRSGDVSAIKYFNELTGRYVPSRVNNLDVSVILMRVIEAIQKHVTSPAEQELVAQELMMLAQAAQLETGHQNLSGPQRALVVAPVGNQVKGQVVV